MRHLTTRASCAVLGIFCLSVVSTACPSSTTGSDESSSSGETASGSSGQANGSNSGSSGTSGASGGSSSSSGGTSSGMIIRDPDPLHPDNANRDSDCDGLTDDEEYGRTYAGGAKTDPHSPDSDG